LHYGFEVLHGRFETLLSAFEKQKGAQCISAKSGSQVMLYEVKENCTK